jgi:hypothetical protein
VLRDLQEKSFKPEEGMANATPLNNRAPLICSFFAGAGFLDLGFEKAGFEIGYVNEYHPRLFRPINIRAQRWDFRSLQVAILRATLNFAPKVSSTRG